MIRKATIDDIDWMMSVAAVAYPNGTYEEEAGRKYWESIMGNKNCLLLRGEKVVMGAAVISSPYAPNIKFGITLPIASLGNSGSELLKMTKQILQWAKDSGAIHFNFAAITGVDLGPLAKRFNGVPISPSYVVRFDHV
ncbi:hypothetical protein UFOVP1078_15 [uncultured Caudovirales phage]|uniref:Uncharacterized protein n=1 Tax=uncultured Caudovirales phage TaxID=2100421 RepID=A0A6J5PGA9_9CAUD|nr:hypothetical protein UFOVP289_26 [uncultured Caudovirales phage]CAB4149986.1 hypothetical protein UFOVP547_21 [uncultured Caudovirales phage]CAB4170097.1 hypothetical protein UFOVP900_48 [uncultured Caudovirales phage]CAB4182633.1 hypothetical protein UFOVP1078_15 [uncultured Caudovirales phage]CAB4197320.1 hypothetical protein UFOVP1317_5 [uncultured Caudovirales phage]